MNKLNTFWYSFKRSLSDTTYYRDILQVGSSFSMKYLFMLCFFITLISSFHFAVGLFSIMPDMPKRVAEVKSYVGKAYPSELEVQVTKGVVSTNVQEPYYVEIPGGGKLDEAGKYQHLLVIDTAASTDDFAKYNAMILVTKNTVVYPDDRGKSLGTYKVTQLPADLNYVLNKTVYAEYVKIVNPYIDMIPSVVTVLIIFAIVVWPFIGGLLYFSGQLFYLIFAGFIVWMISKSFKHDLSFGKVYQLCIHGMTGPMVGTYLLGLFNIQIAYLFTVGLLLWMSMVLSKLKVEEKQAV